MRLSIIFISCLILSNCVWCVLSELTTSDDNKLHNIDPNVVSIDISHKSIRTLSYEDLNFTSLQYFNASHNKLNGITSYLFILTPNIIDIDLSHNNISRVSYDVFDGLNELKVLNLSHNRLKYFNFDQFENLQNFKQIDLRGNQLKIFRCDSENRLPHCASLFFPWESLEILNMGVHCINLNQLTIDGNTMIYTPNTTTSDGLPCPKLGRHPQNALEVFEYLNSSITVVAMAGHFLGKLNCSTFKRFSLLEGLDLARTSLQDFDCDPFENLEHLKYLDISENNFTTLNIPLLGSTLRKLQSFDAKNNRFNNTADSLHQLGMLGPLINTMELNGTPIGKLNADTFQGFNHLTDLELENTNLTDFDSNPFVNLNELTFINLNNNKLVRPNFNGRVPKLISLILVNNSLTALDGITVRNYNRLMGVNVLNNPISCDYLRKLRDSWWGEFHLKSSSCGLE